MLTAGQFRDDSAIAGVGGDLRGHDRRESVGAALHNGGCGLVAGGFDGQDEAVAGHVSSLASQRATCVELAGRAGEEWVRVDLLRKRASQ